MDAAQLLSKITKNTRCSRRLIGPKMQFLELKAYRKKYGDPKKNKAKVQK